jgi:hypothetical protein
MPGEKFRYPIKKWPYHSWYFDLSVNFRVLKAFLPISRSANPAVPVLSLENVQGNLFYEKALPIFSSKFKAGDREVALFKFY